MNKRNIYKYTTLYDIFVCMKRSSTIARLQRLELLKSRLKSGEPTTIGDLADELGISTRTVNRDIEILREQGTPVEADRGRGGGVRLDIHWGIGRVNFNYAEAVDLLITLAIAEQMKSPLFMTNLKGIRHKLNSSLSPSMKDRVKNLKQRILIAPSASIDVLSGYTLQDKEITEQLHQAFLMQQCIEIHYKAKNNNLTKRIIQPQFLLLSSPVWYILAWDELRNDVRTFRCDRVVNLMVQNKEFRLMPVSHFKLAMEGIDAI